MAGLESSQPSTTTAVNTSKSLSSTMFIMEAGIKLHMREEACATAMIFYHMFCSTMSETDYDLNMVAMAALNLAAKSQEHSTKLGDIVNTCHRCFHKVESPLEVGDLYWQLKDSVARYELLLLRALKFHVHVQLPHPYLLHNLLALSRWIDEKVWQQSHVTKVAWALLQDSFHTTLCLRHEPVTIATAVIYLAFHCCKIEVPGDKTANRQWWAVFSPDTEEKLLQEISEEIMAVYDSNTV